MDFGLDTLVVKWAARGELKRLTSLCQFRIAITFFWWLILLIVSFFLNSSLCLNFVAVGSGFLFYSFLSLMFSYWRGLEDMKWEPAILFFQKILLLGLVSILLCLWNSSLAVSLAFALSNLITLLATAFLFFFDRVCWRDFFYVDLRQLSILIKEAWPLAVVGVLGVLSYRTDTIMLPFFRPMEEVGEYNGAFKVIEGLMLLIRVVLIVTFPKLSRLGKSDSVHFKAYLMKLFLLTSVVIIILAASLLYFSGTLFDVFLGPEYKKCVPIFKILLLAVVFMYAQTVLTHALIAIDRHRVYMSISVIGSILNIGLNLIVIPQYGALGAAFATALTACFVVLLCFLAIIKFCTGSILVS